MITLFVASLSCIIWGYLLAARGGFWLVKQGDDALQATAAQDVQWPGVVAVIPARDEATVIGETIASLLRQEYRGTLTLIVVDDHSSDDTEVVVRRAVATGGASDRVTVLAAPNLPDGWTGKLWAVHHGASHVQALPDPPDYLLFTDADIQYADDTLTELVRRAERDGLVLVSLMPRLRCQTFAERALIPAFIFFFRMLYPFAWVNRPGWATAAAAGGCMLVQRRALQTAGGIAMIRGQIIDDCALARLLKGHGPIWLGMTQRVCSVRANASLTEIRRMVVRSAYAQLAFSPWWLAAATLGMIITFLAPPALALLGTGSSRLLGSLAWAIMALAFQPTLRFYAVSLLWGLALPAIAAMYVVFTLDSAYQHWRGRGGEWKGRIYRRASSYEASSRPRR